MHVGCIVSTSHKNVESNSSHCFFFILHGLLSLKLLKNSKIKCNFSNNKMKKKDILICFCPRLPSLQGILCDVELFSCNKIVHVFNYNYEYHTLFFNILLCYSCTNVCTNGHVYFTRQSTTHHSLLDISYLICMSTHCKLLLHNTFLMSSQPLQILISFIV